MSTTQKLQNEFSSRYVTEYFTYDELCCKCDRCVEVRKQDADSGAWFKTPEFTAFMAVLIELREKAGFPFVITSGHRCPNWNNILSSTGFNGPHTIGAVDIAVTHERAYKLNQLASARNLGLGPNQAGSLASRFFHIDNIGPRLWTYAEKQ